MSHDDWVEANGRGSAMIHLSQNKGNKNLLSTLQVSGRQNRQYSRDCLPGGSGVGGDTYIRKVRRYEDIQNFSFLATVPSFKQLIG